MFLWNKSINISLKLLLLFFDVKLEHQPISCQLNLFLPHKESWVSSIGQSSSTSNLANTDSTNQVYDTFTSKIVRINNIKSKINRYREIIKIPGLSYIHYSVCKGNLGKACNIGLNKSVSLPVVTPAPNIAYPANQFLAFTTALVSTNKNRFKLNHM